MTALKIIQFGGQVPRVSPRALPAGAAQSAHSACGTRRPFRCRVARGGTGLRRTGCWAGAAAPVTALRAGCVR